MTREAPYSDAPYPLSYTQPIGPFGPHNREFVNWLRGRDWGRGHQWIGMWRGWCIRVYPQLDMYQGRNVVRWYAQCDNRHPVNAKWTAEAAQQEAIDWIEYEENR